MNFPHTPGEETFALGRDTEPQIGTKAPRTPLYSAGIPVTPQKSPINPKDTYNSKEIRMKNQLPQREKQLGPVHTDSPPSP